MTAMDWGDIEATANEAAGNHRGFDCFVWHERPKDDENWAIVYTHNRDSGLMDQSNADQIDEALVPFIETGDVHPERHNHRACGWVDGYVIRVYRPDKSITEAFEKYCELQQRLADYPVLDEEDYSRREYEATLENIESVGRRMVRDDAPEDWPGQVFSWFCDHNQGAVENSDDQGGYPSDDEMREALATLGFLGERPAQPERAT